MTQSMNAFGQASDNGYSKLVAELRYTGQFVTHSRSFSYPKEASRTPNNFVRDDIAEVGRIDKNSAGLHIISKIPAHSVTIRPSQVKGYHKDGNTYVIHLSEDFSEEDFFEIHLLTELLMDRSFVHGSGHTKSNDPFEDFLKPKEALATYEPKLNTMPNKRLVNYVDGLRKAIETGGWDKVTLERRLEEAQYELERRMNPAKDPGFYIWSESFESHGAVIPAYILGWATGVNFQEACRKYAVRDPHFALNFDEVNIKYYGRGLYSNESDARKAFG